MNASTGSISTHDFPPDPQAIDVAIREARRALLMRGGVARMYLGTLFAGVGLLSCSGLLRFGKVRFPAWTRNKTFHPWSTGSPGSSPGLAVLATKLVGRTFPGRGCNSLCSRLHLLATLGVGPSYPGDGASYRRLFTPSPLATMGTIVATRTKPCHGRGAIQT